jgi:hypothetical protein
MGRATADPLVRLRAWWFHRQGLTPASAPTSIEGCLQTAGWVTTSGSPNLYVSIRARMPGASRTAVDRLAMDGTAIVEVPGAQGRPAMVVPQAEAALVLRLHYAAWQKHAAAYFRSGRGPSEAQFDGLCRQVMRALDEAPLSSGDVRARVTHPDAAEMLSSALATLAIRGIVRRFPSDGRLDSPKYLYELRHPDDRPDLDAEGDHATVVARSLADYLRRHGPATTDEMAHWGALTKGDVRTALKTIGAEAVEIPGWAKQAWLAADTVKAWQAFDGPPEGGPYKGGPHISLLPYRDPYVYVRRPPGVLAGNGDGETLDVRYGKVSRGRIADAESGLSHHVVVSNGELVGLWEYDPAARRVVSRLWKTDRVLKGAVADAAEATTAFINSELGDFKLSAVDPADRRAKRLKFLKSG